MPSLFGPSIEKLKAKRDVAGLLKALDDKKYPTRAQAAEALGDIGGTLDTPTLLVVVTRLVGALDDRSDEVHDTSSQALGKIGAPVIETLINVVRTRDRLRVWTGIESALGLIGAPAVGPVIERLLDEPDPLGTFAERTLTRIGASSVEPLLAVLVGNGYEVRERAIAVLGKIGRTLQDRELCARIVKALVAITGKQDEYAYTQNVRLCAGASVALRDITGEDVLISKWQDWLDSREQKAPDSLG
jgi:HEAT repeat protein